MQTSDVREGQPQRRLSFVAQFVAAVLILAVPAGSVLATGSWRVPSSDTQSVRIAPEDATGLNVLEPVARPLTKAKEGSTQSQTGAERVVQDWIYTGGGSKGSAHG